MSVILKPTLGSQPNLEHPLMPNAYFGLFNEGSGNIVSDLSGNNNQGTLVDDITWSSRGRYGPALFSNGATGSQRHHVLIADSPELQLSSEFTIIINIYADGLTQDLNVLVSKFPNYLFTVDGAGQLVIRYKIGGAEKTVSSATDIVVTGKWYQLAVTRTAVGVTTIWRNAEPIKTLTFVGTVETDTTALLIGNQSPASTRSWEGILDIPMIYNRALFQRELAEILREPFVMFDRTPLELWVGATSVGVPAVGIPILRRRRAG